MGTVELYPVDMAEITVRAEQRTVDWDEGAMFDVERTPFVDKLIADGRLTVVLPEFADDDAKGPDYPGVPVTDAPVDEYTVPAFLGTDEHAPWVDENGKLIEPPRSGRGSSVDVWRAFLTHLGVEFDAEFTRDELIELWAQNKAAKAAGDDLKVAREQATETLAGLNKELDES